MMKTIHSKSSTSKIRRKIKEVAIIAHTIQEISKYLKLLYSN